MDAFDGVTAVSELFDEKIDVYIHGDQYTQGWFGGKLLRERYWRCGHPGRFVLSTPANKFAGDPFFAVLSRRMGQRVSTASEFVDTS